MLFVAIFTALIGLWISWKIYRTKRLQQKLVCPRRASCDMVIHSRYAHTLGIPNDLIGIAYFSIVGILLSVQLVGIQSVGISATLLLLATVSVLFSLYLIFVQAFTLRAWCLWCLGTAVANIILWLCIHQLITVDVLALLAQTKIIWVLLHNVGFILGVGGATITDVFFFKFLKDFKITAVEKEFMDHLSQIIWVGLIVLVFSGYFLYLPQSAQLLAASKFQLKLIVVSVIIINGVLLNMKVASELASLSFEGTPIAVRQRRFAFALGAISMTSWYSAFILGSLRSIPIGLALGVGVYGGLLLAAIIGSQLFERHLTKAAHEQTVPLV